MKYEFSLFTTKYSAEGEVYCNLKKGDIGHSCHQFIRYCNYKFTFIDYTNSVVDRFTEMPDYTVLDDAEQFQESLIFDTKYICTLEEVIELQKVIKEYCSVHSVIKGHNDYYYFNI